MHNEYKPIGLWGQRHKRYLQEHKRAVYTTLLTSGKLTRYLADNDEQAAEMMFRLVEQMAGKEGVTEHTLFNVIEQPYILRIGFDGYVCACGAHILYY